MVFLFPSVATTPLATTALASGAKAAQPPTTPNVTMMTRYPMRANTRGSSLTRGRALAIRLPSSSFFALTRSTPRGAFSAEDSDERIQRNIAPHPQLAAAGAWTVGVGTTAPRGCCEVGNTLGA